MPELDIEAVLRSLPRRSFKAALRRTLQPQTITPYIVLRDVDPLVSFIQSAFGGEELVRLTGSGGGTHCEVRVGDSKLMIGGGSTQPMPTSLHYYVRDVDEVYRRSIEAGAKSLMPPRDQEYGDRDSAIEDVAGNQWYIGTSKGEQYKPADFRAVTLYLHPAGADKLLEFVERVLGGKTIERFASPQGAVMHAKMLIGNSFVEMGEAHDQWPPMPTMVYMIVDDADAMYKRAVKLGAKSVMTPIDQPYGARIGAVQDFAGNQWYMASPIKPSHR